MPNEASYPREAALKILRRVLAEQIPLDVLLEQGEAEFSSLQRQWLQENLAGVLRWKGRLEAALEAAALFKKPTGFLRRALLLAAYQLCVQDRVPGAQVVSETVELVKRRHGIAAARFANAVLRKIAAHASEYRNAGSPAPDQLSSELGAAWASLPLWFWVRLLDAYGPEWAQRFALACLERPRIWIRWNEERFAFLLSQCVSRQGEAASSLVLEAGPVPGAYQVLSSVGPVSKWPGFQEGAFFVQDISSQQLVFDVAQELKLRLSGRTLRALDLCAAPGGKAAGLAWSGFHVVATDRDQRRTALLEETVRRVAPTVQCVARDQVQQLGGFDLVWVDAPCSGSGIIRRHPDVRWLRQEADLQALTRIQCELVQEAWEYVLPGGFLMYSVCSVFLEEGPKIVEELGWQAQIQKQWFLAPQGDLGGDGFWAALLRKPETKSPRLSTCRE